jgi:hypothetical protein
VTEQIFKIGSMEPGAMLYEASKEFQVIVVTSELIAEKCLIFFKEKYLKI